MRPEETSILCMLLAFALMLLVASCLERRHVWFGLLLLAVLMVMSFEAGWILGVVE